MKRKRFLLPSLFAVLTLIVLFPAAAMGEESEEELAEDTQNPIAALINLRFEFNPDYGIGPADAGLNLLKFQPVIPFPLNREWNLITRTIIPFIDAESPIEGGDDKRGLGDITQEFYFSPRSMLGGWTVGAGPLLVYPTATEEELGGEKWAAGPTVIVLTQPGGFTYGVQLIHIWSFAGDDDRENVSTTFIQPFFPTPPRPRLHSASLPSPCMTGRKTSGRSPSLPLPPS